MHTVERVAHGTVFVAVTLNHVEQRPTLAMRHVAQRHLFPTCRNLLIDSLENGNQLLDESAALLIQFFAILGHLPLPDVEHRGVGLLFHPQECVPLLQRLVVVGKRLDIRAVVLRNHHIHQPAAVFTGTVDEERVGRRYENDGNQSDVVREPPIFLLVALEMLLRATLHPAINRHRHVGVGHLVAHVFALDDEKILVVIDDLRVDWIVRAATEREVIDRVEQVGLPLAVVTNETVHFRRQLQRGLVDVLIIENGNSLQNHRCKVRQLSSKNEKTQQKISPYRRI